jgi:hypothetical protein
MTGNPNDRIEAIVDRALGSVFNFEAEITALGVDLAPGEFGSLVGGALLAALARERPWATGPLPICDEKVR